MPKLMGGCPENLNSPRPPRVDMSDRLLIYLDVLGFGAELEAVADQSDFSALYRKLGIVQQEFGVPSTYSDGKGVEALDKYWGRQIFAFSDCVVIALTLNCEAAVQTGKHDLVADAVDSLALAHARCFVNHGILLRGGIGHGWFFREQDKLLSSGLERAHKIESKLVKGAFIGANPETLNWLQSLESNDDLKAGREVTRYFKSMPGGDNNLWQRAIRRVLRYFNRGGDSRICILDYLTTLISSEDPGKAREILSIHKQRILNWSNTEDPRVREKQIMTTQYHNSVVASFGSSFAEFKIP
jgi:hypothetical protein